MAAMYDTFSSDYDRFVNWQNRLAFELPFLAQVLGEANPTRRPVLDAACGTGMHAIALAKRGYPAAGADISRGMVTKAQANAKEAGVEVPFIAAGFGELAQAFGPSGAGLLPFGALLCLGNSLPHLLSLEALSLALADFAACLEPGGLLLVQNRNFDAVLRQRERWMEPQAHREGDTEWLFLRFYDYEPDGLINFNIVTLRRGAACVAGGWQQQVTSTPLYPLRQGELVGALEKAGFGAIQSYGGMDGSPFDPQSSGNLVITARLGR